MRTHIDIDDALLEEVRSLGGYRTIKAAVNQALAEHVKQLKRQQLLESRGQFHWTGDLDLLRQPRLPDECASDAG
ncbi:MAG: type II toxin-antitoxin system VapB family antitoxin [Cyanobacteria bacterium J06642_2]